MGKGLSQAKTLRGRLRVSFGCLICDIQPWTGILSLWAGLQWVDLSQCICAKSCLTLCNPLDRSPPGSSVHGIFQTRILEWVAMPSSRGSS